MKSKENFNGALKPLTKNMSNGILPLTEKTPKMLKQKHLKPNETASQTLLQRPTLTTHPIVHEDVDESLITKAAPPR